MIYSMIISLNSTVLRNQLYIFISKTILGKETKKKHGPSLQKKAKNYSIMNQALSILP